MADEYNKFLKQSLDLKHAREERHRDLSRDKLFKAAKKKIQTTMIGALSTLEQSFGFLWGFDTPEEERTPEQKKAYIIADNKLSENAEWDMGVYYSELKSLSDTGFDLSLLGDSDLSNLNFEPETNPQVLGGEVSDRKMETAENRLKNQFEDSAKDYRDVICPNCGEEFQIDGY